MAELLHVGGAAVVDGRGVDDGGEHSRVPRQPGDLGKVVGGSVDPEVGAVGGVDSGQQLEERAGPVGRRPVQHHRCEVEQDTVEQHLQVGLRIHPQRGRAVVEVEQRLLAIGDTGADVPAPGPGRAPRCGESGEQVGAAERRDRQAVEGGAGQLFPDGVVRVAVVEPARLAQHGRGGAFPVGARMGVLGTGQGQRPLIGLELLRLVQPALDRLI